MVLIKQQMELKMILNTEQLDYLIGETQTNKRRLESANREAKMVMNRTHVDSEVRWRWIQAKGEKFKTDKELMFINNLLTDLQDMKGGK